MVGNVVDSFSEILPDVWNLAEHNGDPIFVISLVSLTFNKGAGEAAIPVANKIVNHFSAIAGNGQVRNTFIGGVKSGSAFPQIGFLLADKDDVVKMGAEVKKFFEKNSDCGGYAYSI